MLLTEFLPSAQFKLLERRDDPRQEWSALSRHDLLYFMRNLIHDMSIEAQSELRMLTSRIISKSCITCHSIGVSLCLVMLGLRAR